MRVVDEQGERVPRELPLAGLQVLCISRSRTVRLAETLLAEQGAGVSTAVFEAEAGPPEVDSGPAASERELAIAADGTGCAEALLAATDVIVDGRPTTHRAPPGWSAGELRARCGPGLVYCALPPFASCDERCDTSVTDDLLAGMLGAYLFEEDGTPALTRLPISACFAALAGVLGIASALLARERFGHGQRVEVAAFDATFLAMGARALLVNGQPGGDRPPDPWGGPFCCKDGRWIWINLATPKAVRLLARHVGTFERWSGQGLLGVADLGVSSPARALLRQELRALFLGRTAGTWEALGAALGVPVTWVRRAGDVRPPGDEPAHEGVPARAADAFLDERTVEVRLAVATCAASGGVPHWAADRPPSAPWSTVATDGAGLFPLSGVRVVDTTSMLAGPLAGRLLAELGAAVVKVNDPHEEGAGYRWQENRYHTDVNRRKATVLLDLSRAEGRAIGARLLAGADVVLENLRDDAALRLGLDEAHVRRLAPAACHAHVSAFSLPSLRDAPGYEPNGQAVAGLMTFDRRTGAPRMQPFPVNDYGTGLLTALGVVLSLYSQLRGKGPGLVTASLSRTAFFFARAMRAREDEPASSTLWRVRDGWVVAECAVATVAKLVGRLAGDDEAPGGGCMQPDASTRGRVEALDAETLLARLAREGIAGTVLRSCQWQARRPETAARGVMQTRRYTDDYVVTAVGSVIQLEDVPVPPARWVARPGGDGPSLLEALGFAPAERERLAREGTVAFG